MNAQTSGMHAPGVAEEHAAVLRHGGSARQQMLEHGAAGLAGMNPLTHLRQLLRVAEQHDVSRGGAHRDRVCQRHLAGFVDEEIVERLSIPSRENSHAVPATSAASPASHASFSFGVLDQRAVEADRPRPHTS